MRAHLSLLVSAGLALLAMGCLSSGTGYDLSKSTLRDRTQLSVPADEDSEAVRKDLLAKPLTADAAARLALANSANVSLALANVGVGRARLLAALRLPNPHAEVGAHFHGDQVDLELRAGLDIVPLLLMPAREAAASEALDASSLEAAGALLDVAFAAKIAFYEYQAAAQVLALRRTVTYAAAQSSEIAAKLLEAGNVPELEALRERALYEETRLALARAELSEAGARERLSAAMGLHGALAASWKVAASLPEPSPFDASNLESKAVRANLTLAALNKRYGAASVESDVAWAQGFLPSLELGASGQQDHGEWEVGPHVGVGIPLFYQGQAEVAAADAEMRLAKSAHAVTAVRIRATARSLAVELEGARTTAEFYKKTLLPLRERIVEETLLRYNAMDSGPSQVLQAKRDQIESARGYVEVLREYWVARARVEMLLAGRSPALPAPSAPAGPPSLGASASGHD